tara:strand:+ start:518 stop:1096 length:579 start_codon:yes stop_codon:yes gene_type:complete
MKKLNFLCLFFVLFSLSESQELNNNRMGLYVAPTINFISTQIQGAETNNNLGLIYGYAVEFPLSLNHYLESGFAINYKGGGIEQSENNISDYKVQYLTIPVFMKMRSRQVGYFNYFAKIGPSLNFKIKEKITHNETAKGAVIDIAIFLGAEYSLGGETAIEGSIFYNNNITSSMNETQALFHQIGLRFGFLF